MLILLSDTFHARRSQSGGVAPAADDAVGGARGDIEGGGEFGVGLTVELGRKRFEELALLEGGSCGDD